MKKIIALVLVLVIAAGMVSCAGCAVNPGGKNSGPSADASGNAAGSGPDQSGNSNPEKAKLTGKINIIDLDDRDPSILRGIKIFGNQAGTTEWFTKQTKSLDGVRCIFELYEWIEFYPDTDAKYNLRVWVLKHRDDMEYYNSCQFSDLMPNFVSYCDLHYPADEENPSEYPWGSFYLSEDEVETGYYDFVFTYEGKAIATLMTRFYKVHELSSKSDAELEALMKE